MEIKISIIIPCYNVKKWLINRAIKSILIQDFNDYEIIIVDDGSGKTYHDYLISLEKENVNIRLITVKNQGVSAARNIGIAESKGEYITFLDADDAFVPGFLKRSYNLILEENPDIVIGGIKISNKIENRNINFPDKINYEVFLGSSVTNLKKKFIGKHNLLKFNNDGGYIGRGPVCRLVKKDLAQKHLFKTNIKLGEDLVWNLELLSSCNKVLIAYEQWYWYWINPSSVTHKYNPDVYEQWIIQLNEINKLVELSNPEIYGSYLERIYEGIYIIWNCYLCNSTDEKANIVRNKLYTETPWTLLMDNKIKNCKSKRVHIFAKMHKYHLLFVFFKLRKMIGK